MMGTLLLANKIKNGDVIYLGNHYFSEIHVKLKDTSFFYSCANKIITRHTDFSYVESEYSHCIYYLNNCPLLEVLYGDTNNG